MGSLRVSSDQTQMALRLRKQSFAFTTLGVVGLGYASLLIAPKLALLIGGSVEVVGVGFIANLGLVFGSLMFLRNAQQFRRQATSLLRSNGAL
jgi:hypothetical protein